MSFSRRWGAAGASCALALLSLGGCAHRADGPSGSFTEAARQWKGAAPAATAADTEPGAEARPQPPAGLSPWQQQAFPGKRRNRYQYVWRDGRPAMAVSSHQSISAMRRMVQRPPDELGGIRFSWKVDRLLADADLLQSAKEDSPVRVVLVFEGDRSRFSARDAMLSELARTLTGEPLPYATLMYVWSNQLPVGTVVNNRRTDRIRKLVLQSGPEAVGRWIDHERDIRADYEQVFGEPPGLLKAVAIMTDTDNTASTVQAWYGPIVLQPAPAPGGR